MNTKPVNKFGKNLPNWPLFNTLREIKRILRFQLNLLRYKRKKKHQLDQKTFIIGLNKTGTTSLKALFEFLGYVIGDQVAGEKLIRDYARQDFKRILELCDTAEVFQDIPFSLPGTYKVIYENYPNAKYILSERDSAEQWYRSITRFHKKIVNNGEPIDAEHLKNHFYRWKGYLFESQQIAYGATEETLYDEDLYKSSYRNHNADVKEFFKGKDNFICINLSAEDAEQKLADFLSVRPAEIRIPHENKT